jgi:YhcH/YjgK/YiaL family protein
MILDTLANAAQYKGIHAGIDQVLEAAKAYTPENYPSGRVVLDGDNVFMNMAAYETHATETAVFEAHKQYIDVMVMVEGTETIYVKATDALSHVYQEYKPEVEALLADFDTDATPVRLEAGSFVVLFPQDAHSPACHVDGPVNVKKIIGKVRI